MQNIQFQTTQKAEQILQYVKKVINESELDLITACVYVHAHASELGETCGKLIPQQFTQFTLIWPSMLNISQPLLCELPKNYNIHISMFLSVFFYSFRLWCIIISPGLSIIRNILSSMFACFVCTAVYKFGFLIIFLCSMSVLTLCI